MPPFPTVRGGPTASLHRFEELHGNERIFPNLRRRRGLTSGITLTKVVALGRATCPEPPPPSDLSRRHESMCTTQDQLGKPRRSSVVSRSIFPSSTNDEPSSRTRACFRRVGRRRCTRAFGCPQRCWYGTGIDRPFDGSVSVSIVAIGVSISISAADGGPTCTGKGVDLLKPSLLTPGLTFFLDQSSCWSLSTYV